MKRIFKWLGILLGVLVLLIIAGGVIVMLVVDKELIAGRMGAMLNRHVTIDTIDAGLFSVVSGIDVTGVRVSNYKTPEQLEALKGKPVPENDLFAGLKGLSLRLRLVPLLSGNVQVAEFVLHDPVIHLVKNRDGTFNFSDLLQPETEEKEPSKPFSADDLPFGLTLGRVGVERGTVTYLDLGLNQTLQVYDLTLLAHSADIDPSQLAKRNDVKIRFKAGIKPKEPLKTGAVRTFDIGLAAEGSVKPFDVKTRLLDPEVALQVESHHGSLSGVRILEALQAVKALEPYTGKLSFLQEEVTWKKAGVVVWYKADNARLSTGRIAGEDYSVDFSGSTNIDTKAIDLDLGMELGPEAYQAIRSSIEKNLQNQIRGDVAKYVSAERLTDMIMKHLTNEEGKVYLKYKVTGTAASPRPTLVAPTLPSLQALLKEAGADAADIAREAAEKEAQKAIEKGTQQLEDELRKRLRF